MARYIDVDTIKLKGIAVLDENLDFLVSLSDVRKSLQMTPAADVVPRAEVDRLQAELEDKQFRCDSCDRIALTSAEHKFCIKKSKAEVAREIFEEIEYLLKIVKIPCVNEDGCITPLQAGCWAIDPEDYAKFKQRFTEGE